jgi:hypothetical protein
MAEVTYRTVMLSGQPAPGVGESQFEAVASGDFSAPNANTSVKELALNSVGQVAFQATIAGADVNESSNQGIWAEGPDGLHLVVRENSPAPGAAPDARFVSTPGFTFNNAGHVAFISKLWGPSINDANDEGIWSDRSGKLAPIALEGMAAPGTAPRVVFGHRGPVETQFGPLVPNTFRPGVGGTTAFNHVDQIAFSATLNGDGIDDFNNEGIWSERDGTLRLVVRQGDDVPGLNGTTFGGLAIGGFRGPAAYVLNDRGQVAFQSGAMGDSPEVSPVFGIWSEGSGNLQLVAHSGMHAPGTPDGVEFDRLALDSGALNNSGHTFFEAGLRGQGVREFHDDSGLWTNRAGNLQLVAREGGHTPRGVHETYHHFAPYLGQNDRGRLVFRAFLYSEIDTLWSDAAGELSVIASDGQTAPGTNSRFTSIEFGPRAINNAGQVAFMAEAGTDRGIWATDLSGELQLVVRVGDAIEIRPGERRTILALSNSMTPNQFNDAGQLAFWATLSGGLEGIFVANQGAAIPEPTTATLFLCGAFVALIGRSLRL